jgi:benzoyl-CoA reductase/2-hydroxyglutaryl-CoA dehydratase subunit BcrC/BadD/HgdB
VKRSGKCRSFNKREVFTLKDLKHLIYFENLLDNADNELVEQARKDGKMIMGYTCYHIPEVLLNIDNCVSVRLRAPRTGSVDISTYYMSNYVCEYARALLERAIEGGYQFLDGLAAVDACSMMNRFYEHFGILKCNDKDHFFLPILDVPYKTEEFSYRHMQRQFETRLLPAMAENLGTDISDAKIREAVAMHNEVCKVIQEISEMRKADNPVITGYEFHVINLVSYTCPKYLILPYLKETLAELKKRKPDEKLPRARVGIVGSEIDDPEFTKMIEAAGARVVFDRHCFGAIPGR